VGATAGDRADLHFGALVGGARIDPARS